VTPAEFVRARLDERERSMGCPEFVEDTASVRGPGWGSVGGCPLCGVHMWDGYESSVEVGWYDHVEEVHQRTRVLREVAALRAMVDKDEGAASEYGDGSELSSYGDTGYTVWRAHFTMCTLAAIWSDHPDYDPAWTLAP
jgi:hypothetical protein